MESKTEISESTVKMSSGTEMGTTATPFAPPAPSGTKKSKKAKKEDKDAGLTEEEKRLREEQRKRAARKKRKKLIKTGIILLIILGVIGFIVWKFIDIKRREEAANTLVTYTVERRTITEKLSATGTLQPVDSYTVTAKVRGDIIAAYFEEGDEVKKDDVLYVIDSDDMSSTVRQREMSLEKAKKTLKDLKEKRSELEASSDLTGTILKLYVEEGDTVQKGSVIADIVDNESMLIDIPFHADHAAMMGPGTAVTLIIDGSGERLGGTVTEVSSITETNPYGAPIRDVTVRVSNPGGIDKTTKAIAECGSDITSTDISTFYYNVEEQLTAEYGGEIKTLNIKEGGRVYDGQIVIVFDEDSLEDQIKDAEDNLETAQMNYDDTIDTLGDYEIKAPITGTVVEKGFNVGESIDVTTGNATVAIIYDLSALTFDMAIDELDIFSIKKGQVVEVTSEALSDVFYGEITKISKVGTVINGTTTYPVTVTITDSAALEKLLPNMNVDAEVTVNRVENVLAIPTGAVARGGTVKVIKDPEAVIKYQEEKAAQQSKNSKDKAAVNTEKKNSQTTKTPVDKVNGHSEDMPAIGTNGNTRPDMPTPEGTAMPDIPEGVIPAESDTNKAPFGTDNGSRDDMQRPAVYGSAPADTEYESIRIETGISDDDFIEVISGLEEGDMVIIEQNQASNSGFGMMGMGMPGMGGMPPGGGMPGGGMPGGGMSGGGANRGGMGGGMPR